MNKATVITATSLEFKLKYLTLNKDSKPPFFDGQKRQRNYSNYLLILTYLMLINYIFNRLLIVRFAWAFHTLYKVIRSLYSSINYFFEDNEIMWLLTINNPNISLIELFKFYMHLCLRTFWWYWHCYHQLYQTLLAPPPALPFPVHSTEAGLQR